VSAADVSLDVPRELSITGFDDVAMAAQIDPPLTTMRIQNAEIGRLAAAYLLTCLAGAVPSPVPALVPDFVERCSTAPPGPGRGGL